MVRHDEWSLRNGGLFMRIGDARRIARDWVTSHASEWTGFVGACFAGSTVGLPDDAILPDSSDVDVMVFLDTDSPPVKPGKMRIQGALVEISLLSFPKVDASPAYPVIRKQADHFLNDVHLAGILRTDSLFLDPQNRLRPIQRIVMEEFAQEVHVRARLAHVRSRIETGIHSLSSSAPFHALATGWLFPTGITTHLLLTAALCNPTVRLRYVAAREVLCQYGMPDFHEELLAGLGCASMSPSRVRHHLERLKRTFDETVRTARTPFFFSSDITPEARPIVVEGSEALIQSGLHRESIFWIAATFARCHAILAADAPEGIQAMLMPDFQELMSDLGAGDADAILRRGQDTLDRLPACVEAAESIYRRNPSVLR